MRYSELGFAVLTGRAIAGAARWAGGLAKTWVEHILAQRKAQAEEQRIIRVEEREQARKDAERKQSELEKHQKDEGTLTLYKARINACSDLNGCAPIVSGLYTYFSQRPEYMTIPGNKAFIEKYYRNFCSKHFGTEKVAELKRDVETLQVGS